MSNTFVDLVKIIVTSTGTGSFTLGSAVYGYRGVEALENGKTYGYSIQQDAEYEYGRGTYFSATNTLTRTVLGSSSGGAAIALRQNAQIAFVALAEDMAAAAAQADAARHSAGYATYAEAAADTGWTDGERTTVSASDTGTHIAVSGDIGSGGVAATPGDAIPNGGDYKYSVSAGQLLRTGDSLEQAAATSAANAALASNPAQSQWLHTDGVTLTGVAAGLSWTTASRKVRDAIAYVVLHNPNPAVTPYRIVNLGNDHATNGDRIIVNDKNGTQVINTGSATVAKSSNGVTNIEFTSGSGARLSMSIGIDYGKLDAATYYDLSAAPLFVATTDIFDVVGRKSELAKARNIAFDGALAGAGSGASFSMAGTAVAATAANAALTAYGVVYSHRIGTGTTATNIYKRDLAIARPNKKYGFVSALVYSADGVNWPSGTFEVFPYDAVTGGSIVSNTRIIATGADQLTANVRRYWIRFQLPTTGTIASISYGFSALATGAAVEIGGWTLALSESQLSRDNVATLDWTGYSTRDTWRDSVDTNLAHIQSNALINYPYTNAVTNPNLDPDFALPMFNGTATIADPTSADFTTHGIRRVLKIGLGGTHAVINDPILDATAANQYFFASTYVYAGDGATFGIPRVFWYSGSTAVGGKTMSTYVQISENVRRYFTSGQLPNSTSLTHIRIGSNSNVSGSGQNVEYGGFTFIRYGTAIDSTNTPVDSWYGKYTSSKVIAKAVSVTNRFSGQSWGFIGDSFFQNYPLVANLALSVGVTAYNFGTGGCQMTDDTSPTGLKVYKRYFSFYQWALAINRKYTGIVNPATSAVWNFEDQEKAADDLFADPGKGPTDDYRAIVTAAKVLDWTALNRLIVHYGTNDWNASKPLGTATTVDVNTINGAFNEGVRLLRAALPNLDICFVGPSYRDCAASDMPSGSSDVDVYPNGAGIYLRDVSDALVYRAKATHAPVLDMLAVGGVDKNNVATYTSADKLHPGTAAGQTRWNNRVSAWCFATL